MLKTSDLIVLNWLNEELNLNPKIEIIQKDFQNGYRFGEILLNLKLISEKEFKEFINSTNIKEIKNNFILLKNYLHSIFSLEVRLEEFNEIINEDKYKSILVLYKIKNSFYKNKIGLNTIQTSFFPLTQEEIEEKIKIIMDNDKTGNQNDDKYSNKNANNYNNEFLRNNDSYKINSVSNKNNTEQSKNLSKQLSEKEIKEQNNEIYNNEENINKNQLIKLNKNNQNHIKKKLVLPIIRNNRSLSAIKLEKNNDNNCEKENNKKLNRNKSQFSLMAYPSLSYDNNINNKINIDKNLLTINLMKFGVKDENIKNSYLLNNIFENQNTLDYRNKLIKQKIKIKAINDSCISKVPEIDFIKKDKKFLDNITNKLNSKRNAFSFLEDNFVLYNRNDFSKYKSSSKRKEYTKIFENEKKNEKYLKRQNFFNKLFYLHQNNFKRIYSSKNILVKNEEEKFNKNRYFKSLSSLNFENFNKYCDKRQKLFKKNYYDIRNIIYYIIDITEEGYSYQKKYNTDLINLSSYLKLTKLFLKNKPIKKPQIDDEFKQIKEANQLDEKIDINKIIISDEEKYLVNDYLYYIGFWNKNEIIDNELLGKKLDYKLILSDKIQKLNLNEEYEPTETECEDLTLPLNNISNFNYGELVYEIIKNRYGNKEIQINNNENNIWSYIPYKISLVGYPLSGKKYISEKISNKFPNLKVYSIHKILSDYYSQYKTIMEPIENIPKFKSMKPKQVEQIQKEKEKQIEKFEPILKIIKPYIDLLENNEEKNKINNDICVPQNEVLLNLLIYKIENDFPRKSKTEIINEINAKNKKINDILTQIDKIKNNKTEKSNKKEKNNKQNQKDDLAKISNLKDELKNIEIDSVNGFILTDFPSNIIQTNLLENYLTGYVDDLKKPKTLKNKIIQKINNLIDIRYQPSEFKIIKKAGIDYIFNLILREEEINNRFNNIKYDPIENKIYSKFEYENMTNKKIYDRLVNEIPYLNKSIFTYYKQEYEDNISEINLFYNKFGFIPHHENNHNNFMSLYNINDEENKSKIIKVFQPISLNDLIQIDKNQLQNNNQQIDLNKMKRISKKLSFNSKKSNKNNKIEIKNVTNNENKENEKLTTYLIDFITNKIKLLIKEVNENENQLIKESSKIEGDNTNINGARKVVSKKKSSLIEKDKLIFTIKMKSEIIIDEILPLNINYNDNLKIFMHLFNKQKFDIHKRLNLIQKKFRDYLNRITNKKEHIHSYITKYNKFLSTNKDLFEDEKVKNEFISDIEGIKNNLWNIINNKKSESISELKEIKNCGYIEIELCKFFNRVKDLFLLETKKFITMTNIIIDCYLKYYIDEKILNLKKSNSNIFNITNNQLNILRNKINEYISNEEIKEEFIIKNISPLAESLNKEKNILNYNFNENEGKIPIDNKSKYTNFSNNILSLLIKNINELFINTIKLLISQSEKISLFLKIFSEVNNASNKRQKPKKKNSQLNININEESLMPSNNNSSIFISEENIKKLLQNEKIKYKYRLCFIKSFSIKYILIISQLSQLIFHNVDEWIVKSVNMENEAQNEIINILKNKLEERELIDEDLEINPIEMDCFEKVIEEEEKSNKSSDIKIKPIDNSSVINSHRIYNKINIEFLLKNNLFDIKLEQIEQNEDKEKEENNNEIQSDSNIININEIKQYKLILPKDDVNLINNSINSEISNISNDAKIINEEEYYYDINKFYEIYKRIKKFEIDKNVISYDIFYEIFIKENFIYNVEKNNNEFNAIPNVFKKLNSKQINKFITFYQIHIDKSDENKINEYEDYIKTPEIFTILSLLGCEILTQEIEEEINSYFKDILIQKKYLDRNDYMKYNFWFEKKFEYQNQQLNITNEGNEGLKTEEKNEKINIKKFLFELWKEENGNNFNLKKFLKVLKISNYITDFDGYSHKKYFDILIFDK